MRPLPRIALASLLLLAASDVWACAVCGGGNPANRTTFFLSTIALSLLPLGLFTGGVLWLRSKLRDQLAEEFRDRDTLGGRSGTAPTADGGAPLR